MVPNSTDLTGLGMIIQWYRCMSNPKIWVVTLLKVTNRKTLFYSSTYQKANSEDQDFYFHFFYLISLVHDSKSGHFSVVQEVETKTLQAAVEENGPAVIPCKS